MSAEITPEFATATRRAMQLVRAYRRRDVAGLNLVVNQLGSPAEGTNVLTVLLGVVSDLLDRLPSGDVDSMLEDLLLEYAAQEGEW